MSQRAERCLVLALTAVLAAASPASSQVATPLRVGYVDDTELALGVGVDETELAIGRDTCIDMRAARMTRDTAGATSSELRARSILSARDVENELVTSHAMGLSAHAGLAGLAAAKSTIASAGSLSSFLKDTENSAVIIIEAKATHGSERLQHNGGLKPEFAQMLAEGRHAEFRARCGTHFVASRTLVSALSVVMTARGGSNLVKTAIAHAVESSSAGGLSLGKFKIGGGSVARLSIADALKIASEKGRVDVSARARGGAGVEALSDFIRTLAFTPEQTLKMLDIMAETARGFTPALAAPDSYGLVSYEIFGARAPTLSQDRMEVMQAIYRRIVRLDAALASIDAYRTDRPKLHAAEFAPRADRLMTLRSSLVSAYRDCRAGGACAEPDTAALDGLRLLSDAVESRNFELHCVQGHELADPDGARRRYLSSADLMVSGILNFPDALDIDLVSVWQVAEDGGLARVSFDPASRLRSFPPVDGAQRFIAQIDTRQVRQDEILDRADRRERLRDIIEALRQQSYIIRFPLREGGMIEELLTEADASSCAVTAR